MPGAFDKLQNFHKQRKEVVTAPHSSSSSSNDDYTPQNNASTSPSSLQGASQQSVQNNTSQPTMVDSARVPTGIRGFDQMIQGGFKKGSVNVVTGGPGSGKTTFAMEFLVNGTTFANDPGIYITFDETKDSIVDNMRAFGWDLERLEKESRVIIVEYSPQQLMKILTDGGGLLDNLMSKYGARRIVVDSVSTFLMLNSTEFGRRELLMSFFRMLSKWDVTTVMINEQTPISGDEIGKATIPVNFECDSIVQLYYTHHDLAKSRIRYIEVFKMRGTNHVTKAIPFKIDSRGIDIQLS